PLVDSQVARDLAHALEKLGRGKLGLAAALALRVERGAQKRHGGDAGDLERILKGEEKAPGGAFLGRKGENVLAVEQHLPLRDDVIVLAGEDVPEAFGPISACTLPRSTKRSSPLRIFLPSTSTCRFFTSSRCMFIPRCL